VLWRVPAAWQRPPHRSTDSRLKNGSAASLVICTRLGTQRFSPLLSRKRRSKVDVTSDRMRQCMTGWYSNQKASRGIYALVGRWRRGVWDVVRGLASTLVSLYCAYLCKTALYFFWSSAEWLFVQAGCICRSTQGINCNFLAFQSWKVPEAVTYHLNTYMNHTSYILYIVSHSDHNFQRVFLYVLQLTAWRYTPTYHVRRPNRDSCGYGACKRKNLIRRERERERERESSCEAERRKCHWLQGSEIMCDKWSWKNMKLLTRNQHIQNYKSKTATGRNRCILRLDGDN
jgi:hypothetical protein